MGSPDPGSLLPCLVYGAQRNVAQPQSGEDSSGLRQGFQSRKQVGARKARLSILPVFPDLSGFRQGLGPGCPGPEVCKTTKS